MDQFKVRTSDKAMNKIDYMIVRNHAPNFILRNRCERPGLICCEPVAAFGRSCGWRGSFRSG